MNPMLQKLGRESISFRYLDNYFLLTNVAMLCFQ